MPKSISFKMFLSASHLTQESLGMASRPWKAPGGRVVPATSRMLRRELGPERLVVRLKAPLDAVVGARSRARRPSGAPAIHFHSGRNASVAGAMS